ncbi:MAG TPA: SDR family oxidoreductase [Acidimicrobiales bacterium]|nr:SDR family oxidoreductase [Acidimicrobiales bacterium]
MTSDLDGKVAIVTGAASGIGAATVGLLEAGGATVVGADIATGVDISNRDAVDALVADTVAQHGGLDILANVAGVYARGDVLSLTDEALDRIFAVNLKGTLYCCQAGARAMIDSGGGSIINVASGAIDTGASGTCAYAMSKAAVVQLTRNLATEVGRNGVRVNVVAPGWIETPMTAANDDFEAMKEMMSKMQPIRRTGQPDDIAHAIVFLASDASSFMTGQILRPNGGVQMPW